MKTEVVEVRELDWPFHGQAAAVMGRYREQVDPFPCYAHDAALVRETLDRIEFLVDIKLAPKVLYILHHEPLARTNGWAQSDTEYNEEAEQWEPCGGRIVLAGKRIPPHPAVTRYVTAHEYGHHVDYDLCRRRDLKIDGLNEEYAKLRRLPAGWDRYGGGCWHSNVGELIANDFRILIAGVEPDYWPHPGYARPDEVDGLEAWWAEQLYL